ncbi:MAG: NfeD family protein [Ruminiclostridium sp.]|nr:NfeD family protein [Ruminiclostridium sp.]
MEWFNSWWNTLELFEQILYCVAIPSTLILLIQTIMLILGFGHSGAGVNPSDTSGFDGGSDMDFDAGGADTDFGGDTGADGADGDSADVDYGDGSNPSDVGTLNFFTVQGIITFLCVFGWAGIVTYTLTKIAIIAVIVGFVLGLAAMYGVAKLMQLSRKLAQNGTLNVRNLLGANGTVYLIVPADGKGKGKVNVTSGERLVEYDAITDGNEELPDGTQIRVIDIRSDNVLVVEKV